MLLEMCGCRKGIFSTSGKKKSKSDDKTPKTKPKPSCLLTEEKKGFLKIERASAEYGKRTSVRFSVERTVIHRNYIAEDIELITERKLQYDNLNLDKNWCITQLHAALLPDTHLYQVELEKDNAFGLGFYLYGLGPDRLVPYVSIYVKDVIKGGYVDRQGTIKPHDQIIKCGKASFVGIKQEEALRIMKNQSQLKLTMGRRTKPDNSPVTKADHKDTLAACGQLWFDPKRNPRSLEIGDFRLISANDDVDPFYTNSKSSPCKTIQIDTNQLLRISNGHSVEDGTPNLNQIWIGRQDYLEEELKRSEKKIESAETKRLEAERQNQRSEKKFERAEMKRLEAERQNHELKDQLRKLNHQKEFASQEARYANVKIGELAQEYTQLKLDSSGVVPLTWDHEPELAAEAIADDLDSLLHQDEVMSISTIRTADTMVCNHGTSTFKAMEMMSSVTLERSIELDQDGHYVLLHTPALSETSSTSTNRFSYPSNYSNYSSRRTSDHMINSNLSSVVSLNSALSYTSDEGDPERTPVNRVIDPRLTMSTVAGVDDGHGEMSHDHMFGDHQDDDGESEEDETDFRQDKDFLV